MARCGAKGKPTSPFGRVSDAFCTLLPPNSTPPLFESEAPGGASRPRRAGMENERRSGKIGQDGSAGTPRPTMPFVREHARPPLAQTGDVPGMPAGSGMPPVLSGEKQPSSSLGEHTPLFEPVHGSWPQAAGQNLANPLAQILSAAMLLEHFGLEKEGTLIREAVTASLDANVRTPEIQVEGGEKYGTREVGEWIVNYIRMR